MPEHNDSPHKHWCSESRESWGKAAAETIPYEPAPAEGEPEELVFSGPCPSCTHGFTYVWPLAVVRAAAPTKGATESVIVRCQCPDSHSGRPEGRKGCGAFWKVEVQL